MSAGLAPRQREQNVTLLRAVVEADSDEAFDAACNALVQDFHPSILAEIDLFEHSAWEGEETHENRARAGLSDHLDARFEAVPDDLWPNLDVRLSSAIAGTDAGYASVRLAVDLDNKLYRALADRRSRTAAKTFVRGWMRAHGPQPFTFSGLADTPQTSNAADVAEELRLSGWASSARELAALLGAEESPAVFAGSGPCGRCSMTFASAALPFIDARTLSEGESGVVRIPDWLNTATCPFCGLTDRLASPTIFYFPSRRQRIYLLPAAPGEDEDAVMDRLGGLVSQVQDEVMAQWSDQDRQDFLECGELLTYSPEEFLGAIQLRETVAEDHVSLGVTFADGERSLVDPTKGVMIDLLEGEDADAWNGQ
jgi:hypothetical protein